MPRLLNLTLAVAMTAGAGILVGSPIPAFPARPRLPRPGATWDLYGIEYWPSFVLIDRKGMIRYEG